MKRVLRALAVLWALALVGWAIAAAQGWVGADDTKELTNAEDTGDRPLFRATKSDAGEGAADRKERRKKARLELQRREQQRRDAEALQAPVDTPPTTLFPATKSDNPALFPSTKSDMMEAIGPLPPRTSTGISRGKVEQGSLEFEPQQQAPAP